MMQFLRKHQKKLFIMIAVMTVASFAFFGNSSSFAQREVEDQKVGTTLAGAPIYDRELRALTQFLSMGASHVMRLDLVETGVFSLLAEKHSSEIQSDFQERLQMYKEQSVALFRYHTFEEWFGSCFADIVGRFILNTAAIAEKRGYQVTHHEARVDFVQQCRAAAQISNQDPLHYMRVQLQMAGLDESRAVGLWRQVMLVHRFFQDIEQGVLLDPIPYEQFSTFAGAKAQLEVYQLPEPLRLKDFRSMLKLQYYLEAVSPKGRQSIADLPRQFYSTSEVEKKHPELVTRRYELEVAKVAEENILSHLSLKKTWDFELSDGGWALMVAEFPVLNKEGSGTLEGREKILDACDLGLRKKIDLLARRSLMEKHPEWVQEALAAQTPDKMVVYLRAKGATPPFNDIEDPTSLDLALQKAEIGGTIQFAGQTHYQIKVLQKADQKQVMTFQEALRDDWLGVLLDEKLEGALAEARKKHSATYKTPDGSWKPYSQVRDHVGAYVYADLLKMLSDTPLTYDEYAAKRLKEVMVQARTSIQTESDASKFLTLSGHMLADQWALLKKREEVKRSDVTELSKAEMFTQDIGSWSSIAAPPSGNVAFFHLLERDTADLKIHDQVTEGQRLLGRDVKRQKIEQLLDEVGAL